MVDLTHRPPKSFTSLSLESMNVLYGKREFTGVIKLWILQWGDYLGFFKWSQYIHKGPYHGRSEAGESKMEM